MLGKILFFALLVPLIVAWLFAVSWAIYENLP